MPAFWKPSWEFQLGECLHSAFNIYSHLIFYFWDSPMPSIVLISSLQRAFYFFQGINLQIYAGMKKWQLFSSVELHKGSWSLPLLKNLFSVFLYHSHPSVTSFRSNLVLPLFSTFEDSVV